MKFLNMLNEMAIPVTMSAPCTLSQGFNSFEIPLQFFLCLSVLLFQLIFPIFHFLIFFLLVIDKCNFLLQYSSNFPFLFFFVSNRIIFLDGFIGGLFFIEESFSSLRIFLFEFFPPPPTDRKCFFFEFFRLSRVPTRSNEF